MFFTIICPISIKTISIIDEDFYYVLILRVHEVLTEAVILNSHHRQLYEVVIQASIRGKVVARET